MNHRQIHLSFRVFVYFSCLPLISILITLTTNVSFNPLPELNQEVSLAKAIPLAYSETLN